MKLETILQATVFIVSSSWRNRKFRWWNLTLPLAVVGLGLAALLLVRDATDAILESADGDFSEVVLDPLAPGFESYVSSTPTHLLGIKGANSELVSIALLSLFTDDIGGSAVVFPVDLLITENASIGEIYSTVSEPEFILELGRYLKLGFNAASFITEADLLDYFELATPLTVLVNDPLIELDDGQPNVAYESGQLVLSPSEVYSYLAWESDDESSYNRWLRHKNFWESWLGSLTDDVAAALGGKWSEKELNRMLQGLSSGDLIIQNLNLLEAEDSNKYLLVEEDSLSVMLLETVPFPIAPFESGRAKIKLLDGIGGVDIVNAFVPKLVASGAEIKLIGNAEQFGVRESLITYYDETYLNFAEAFSVAIGGSSIEFEPLPESVVDVIILIGGNSIE